MVLFSIVLRYRGLNEIFGGCRLRGRERAEYVFKRVEQKARRERGRNVLEIQRRPRSALLFFIHMYEILITFLFYLAI